MRTYYVGFFSEGKLLVDSLEQAINIHSVAMLDNHVKFEVDDSVTEEKLLKTLSGSSVWDGTISENEPGTIEPESEEIIEPEIHHDNLTQIFSGKEIAPDNGELIEETVLRISERLKISLDDASEICSDVVAWFLPYTGDGRLLIDQVKRANHYLTNFGETRQRVKQLETIVNALDNMSKSSEATCVDCIVNVISLIRKNWEELVGVPE